MRIASLQPAATEIVCALGLEDDLVAVSAACNWPPEILGRPVITRPRSGTVRARIGDLDLAALAEVQPDLVIAGPEISVPGGVSLESAVREIDRAISLLVLEPASIEGIFNSIVSVGAMTESEDEAVGLVELLREDLQDLEERVAERRAEGQLPTRLVVLERLEPLVASGRWIPELVRRAGGWDLLGREGEAPRETPWEAVRDVDPEVLVAIDDDQRTNEILYDWEGGERPGWWGEINAIDRGQVYAVEPAFFLRAGPRIIEGIAILAEIMDPEGFVDAAPPGSWSPVFSDLRG